MKYTEICYTTDDQEFMVKEFLNEGMSNSIAAIGIKIESNSWRGSKDEHFYDGEVYISDCTRIITLDLQLNTLEDIANSKYKLETLIKVSKQALEHMNHLSQFIKPRKQKENE